MALKSDRAAKENHAQKKLICNSTQLAVPRVHNPIGLHSRPNGASYTSLPSRSSDARFFQCQDQVLCSAARLHKSCLGHFNQKPIHAKATDNIQYYLLSGYGRRSVYSNVCREVTNAHLLLLKGNAQRNARPFVNFRNKIAQHANTPSVGRQTRVEDNASSSLHFNVVNELNTNKKGWVLSFFSGRGQKKKSQR